MAIKQFLRTSSMSATVALVVSLTVATPNAMANASMRNEMDQMFNSMTNVTQPGVFETSRRGVIAGGSFNMRNRIMNTNVVSMQSMSLKGGCGGIDFFGGSFSFINKDQFIQLVRNIASNAVSYAFYLALDSMSSTIRNIMEDLQTKISEMNKHFSNSCQLAQGIVDNTRDAFTADRDSKASLSAVKASVGDIFESFSLNGKTSSKDGLPAAEIDRLTGNIVWKALKEQPTSSWFTYGGDNLNMAIMSVSGTVIVGDNAPASDGEGTAPEMRYIDGNILRLEDFVRGGQTQILECDTSTKCLNPVKAVTNIEGFAEKIKKTIIGDGSTGTGIITRLRMNLPLTGEEQNMISNLPASAGSMILRLSRINENFPVAFVNDISETLALEMANEVIRSFFAAAKLAVDSTTQQSTQEAVNRINRAEMMYMQDYQAYSSKVQPIGNIVATYNSMLNAASGAGVIASNFSPSR